MSFTMNEREKAIIVVIQPAGVSDEEIRFSIAEMTELARTADISVVGSLIQKRPVIDRNSYLGKGKMTEARELATEHGASLIIADDELSGLQLRRMEEGIELPVTDRTSVILDIFSAHASTREGKLQVQLAQMRYRLIRLAGGYTGLSRQRGGIGTKGLGETKIEMDRRLLRIKVQDLEKELEKVVQDRTIQRKKRTERFAPLFAMVGYTNAGKSTLLKLLTGKDALICDGLFTTLDPTARRLPLPSGRVAILSDTVGFIRKLPHGLVKAFRATLEDVVNAQVIIHVIDVSSDHFDDHIQAVQEVLRQLSPGWGVCPQKAMDGVDVSGRSPGWGVPATDGVWFSGVSSTGPAVLKCDLSDGKSQGSEPLADPIPPQENPLSPGWGVCPQKATDGVCVWGPSPMPQAPADTGAGSVLEMETLMVFNKIDKLSPVHLENLQKTWHDAVFLSAVNGQGRERLLEKMDAIMARQFAVVTVQIPGKHPLARELFQNSRIIRQEWLGEEVIIEAEISLRALSHFEPYRKK